MPSNSRRSFLKSTLALSVLPVFPLNPGVEPDNKYSPPQTIYPKRLKAGNTIAIMGMAGALSDGSCVENCENALKALGFNVQVGSTVRSKHGYLSGTDEERLGEFHQFIADPNMHGILFVRGGWGAARILDKIDYELIKNNPKVISGFSDLTSLLNAVYTKTGVITFHGPVACSSWDPFTIEAFSTMAVEAGLAFKPVKKSAIQTLNTWKQGAVEGVLVGGNLTVFTSLLGTPFFPDCKDKILFFEDTHEEPYRIDRMLTSLHLSGVLNQVSGIIFGQFNDCLAEKPKESFTLEEVVKHHVSSLNIPILWGAPFGHVKEKWTLPIGGKVRLDTSIQLVKLIEPAVA